MRHEYLSLVSGLLQKVWQSCTMINMEVRQQQQIELFWVNHIKVGKGLYAVSAGMLAAIKHDFASFALQIEAGSANLAAGAQRHNLQILARIFAIFLQGNRLKLVLSKLT